MLKHAERINTFQRVFIASLTIYGEARSKHWTHVTVSNKLPAEFRKKGLPEISKKHLAQVEANGVKVLTST